MNARFVLATAAALAIHGLVDAQVSGAIFTTDSRGTEVNANIYDSKKSVYLNGGPQPGAPCTAAGLPDGKYYFMVTDPSGKALLSEDPVECRVAVVSGGIIVAHEATPSNCAHRTGKGPCPGQKTIQLMPYADTPNPGGVYKAWMTPVERYMPGQGFHGFIAAYSKTDNYKVKDKGKPVEVGEVTGLKFYDLDCDGHQDAGEPPIPGWRIELWDGATLLEVTFTDIDGKYSFIRDIGPTVYTIKEVAPGGFVPAPGAHWVNCSPTAVDVVIDQASVAGPVFANVCLVSGTGNGRTKGFWHNENGKLRLSTCDPAWRSVINDLNLRSNDRDPALSSVFQISLSATFDQAHAALADYLVGDAASGVGAFIMSTQLAATALNHSCGWLTGLAYIEIDGALVSLDSLIADGKALLLDPAANDTGPQAGAAGLALRAKMLDLGAIYDSINSNQRSVFQVSPKICEFGSPYGSL